MYTVGLDVDTFVFTYKILLYTGNFFIKSPLVLITIGTIFLFLKIEKSVENFRFSTKATAVPKNTYNKYINLPLVSEHISKHKSNLTKEEFGYFLAGLIEGDG
jgi:hypothetical protein